MKKLMLIAIMCLPFTGCPSADFSFLAEAVVRQQVMHLNLLDVVEGWVKNATGITEEQRTAILGAIAKDREIYLKLSTETIKTLQTMDSLDWDELLKKLEREGREVYDEFMKYYGDLL